jgi:nucleotide-binding universal stress UspA family protein
MVRTDSRKEIMMDTKIGVVVGVDGSDSWTEAFAAPSLTVLMYRSEDQAYEEELLAQRLAGWTEKYPEVEVKRIVVHDRAAHLLIEKSHTAQLVVVGSRGHGEFAGLVLGSVSNALVHKSACPVAIVRPDAAARS